MHLSILIVCILYKQKLNTLPDGCLAWSAEIADTPLKVLIFFSFYSSVIFEKPIHKRNNKMPFNLKKIVGCFGALAVIAGSSIANAPEALACNSGLSIFDPTCPGRLFGPPIGGSTGQSCLAIYTNEQYTVTLTNHKSYNQRYTFDGERYTLRAGESKTHRKTIAYGTNSCNRRTYPMPVVEFDRYRNDGRYTGRRVTLRQEATEYVFWRDNNVIKFSGR